MKSKLIKTLLLVAFVCCFLVCFTACGGKEEEHNHSYASGWTSDETHHWHAATCGHNNIIVKRAHDFVEGVCKDCGYQQQPSTPQGPSDPEPDTPVEPENPTPDTPVQPEPENPTPDTPVEPEPEEPTPDTPVQPAPENPTPDTPVEPEPEEPTPSDPEPTPHEHQFEDYWTVDKPATKNTEGSESRHCVDYESCGGTTDSRKIPAWSSDGGWTPNA